MEQKLRLGLGLVATLESAVAIGEREPLLAGAFLVMAAYWIVEAGRRVFRRTGVR